LNMTTEPLTKISLNVPVSLSRQITTAAKQLGITKAALIRRAVCRDLLLGIPQDLALLREAMTKELAP
jgi:hypothetical protein